jgi:hypothetical protein
VSKSEKIVGVCATPLVLLQSQSLRSAENGVNSKYFKSRYIRSKVRKARLWSLARIGIVMFPSMTIPLCELSLTGLLRFPVFIPSPIGMELAEITTSLLHSSFSFSRDFNKGKRHNFAGKTAATGLLDRVIGIWQIMRHSLIAKRISPLSSCAVFFGTVRAF